MKKVLLLLVAIASVLQVSAQEKKDSLQDQSATVSIDSICVRLNSLQHDYDFMYCDYELHKQIMDLKDLAHSIDISSNGVIIDVYHGRFNRDLYNAFLDNYEAKCALFDSLKEKTEAVKAAVFVRMLSADFTDKELNVISQSFSVIDKATTAVDRSLNYYNVAIKAYRDKI